MIRAVSFFLIFFFLLTVGPVSSWTAPAVSIIDTYKIADSIGDWGFPSPYCMYPRGPGYVRMSLIFDTLIWNSHNGHVPALAKEWRFLEKENAYVFTLHRNVTWHDSKPLTADDVIFTFQYIKKHPWPWFTPAMIKGPDNTDRIDDYTVKIRLNSPYASFITEAACTIPILPRHIWENVELPESFRSKQAVVGSGPFRLMDYDRSRGTYLYASNPGYYAGPPAVRRLIFIKAPVGTAPVMLEKKLINACSLPCEWVEDFKKKGFHVENQPCTLAVKLAINHKHPPLNLKEIRRALAFALDRQKIVSIITRGYAVPASPGLIPPDHSPWFNPNCQKYPFQPETARKLIEAIGFKRNTDGFYCKDGKPLQLELLVGMSSRPEFARLAEFIKRELENIGITINLKNKEGKTVDTLVENWKFQLALQGHGGLGSNPGFLLKIIQGKGFNSARFFENKKLTELLALQSRQMDRDQRVQTIRLIQELYASELPAISLYYPRSYWVHDGSLNLRYTPGGLALGIPIAINKLDFLLKN